jgi:hypothetical protein
VAPRRSALFTACLLSTVSFPAHDQNRPPPAAAGEAAPATGISAESDAEFRSLDRDASGYLTLDELGNSSALAAAFVTADRNNDGRLSPAEYEWLRANTMVGRNSGPGATPLPPPETGTGSGSLPGFGSGGPGR